MRRLTISLFLAFVALAGSTVSTMAIWPTTCVEANDAFERDAGRYENVGIYQRVFRDPARAEAACRNDHRNDIQRTFWWAFDSSPPEPAEISPRVADGLQGAWDLFSSTRTGQMMIRDAPIASTVRIEWQDIVADDPNAISVYSRSANTIYFKRSLRSERSISLAALLAHEMWHTVSHIPYPRNAQTCVQDEVLAFLTQAVVWIELGSPTPITALEVSHQRAAQAGASQRDGDPLAPSSWPDVLALVYELGYGSACSNL